jgi:hypothetical protein
MGGVWPAGQSAFMGATCGPTVPLNGTTVFTALAGIYGGGTITGAWNGTNGAENANECWGVIPKPNIYAGFFDTPNGGHMPIWVSRKIVPQTSECPVTQRFKWAFIKHSRT